MTPSREINLQYFQFFTAALALVLCFWNYGAWSLTNDELSALNRLNYDSFSDLIDQGIRIDGHPAFTQVFLFYWTKTFGTSAYALRLPSVLLTLSGLYFFYRFSVLLFNKKVALLTILSLILSQFFLNYTQLARPYAYGFFACSFFAYSLLQFRSSPNSKKAHLLFVISLCLSFIMHYLATLSAALMLITAFALFGYKYWKRFLGLTLISALILLFHLTITLGHLEIGGLNWLPLPKPSFYREFLYYAFNSTVLFALWPFILLLASLFLSPQLKKFKAQLWVLILATFPYLIIYFYTLHYNPVMQFSSLLFSFPFYLLFLFSFLGKTKLKVWFTLCFSSILLLGSVSLYSSNHFFEKRPFANFRTVIEKGINYQEKRPHNELLSFTNYNDSTYFNYYYDKLGDRIKADVAQFTSTSDIAKAIQLIKTSEAKEILFVFAGIPVPPEVYEFAKLHYPKVVQKKRLFNAEFLVLGKEDLQRETIFKASFEPLTEAWLYDQSKWQDSIFYTSPNAYFIEPQAEFSATYKTTIEAISSKNHPWVYLSLQLKSKQADNLRIVVQVNRKDALIDWKAYDSKAFYQKDEWYNVSAVWQSSDQFEKEDEVAIYLWNPDQGTFYVDDFKCVNYKDSDYFYYNR
ncbi:MAG: glycosyltransferase family 39 protein [Vicingaceae bacterium]